MRKYIIYMHVFPNGKKYIGMTCKERPNDRWEGGTGYSESHQPVMYNAIQKYGWENVEHEILYTDLSYGEAISKEIELIAKYKTNCKRYGDEYGYNMTDGGDGNRGHVVSQEARKKISDFHKGRKGDLCPNSRAVICDGVRYASLAEFKQRLNVKGNFQDWLNGIQGMPQEWYERGLHYADTDMTMVYPQEKPWAYQMKYDGKIFQSQRELSDYMGVSPAAICKWRKRGQWEEKGIERIE